MDSAQSRPHRSDPLRRLSVGQRLAIIAAILLVPLAVLSAVSLFVLDTQEAEFRETVDESLQTLLPLTTLEHYLQRALVDEMQANSGEQVANFGGLARQIDDQFSRILGSPAAPDLSTELITAAQQAWTQARPSIRQIVEQARTRSPFAIRADADLTEAQLEEAIADVSEARLQLAQVVRARYERAAAARQAQLRYLVWGWLATLIVTTVLVLVFLRSLLQPIHQLGRAARRIGAGESGVRVPETGHDELAELAVRFNEMAAHWESTRRTLKAEASEDTLTGTLNRRGIEQRLTEALERHATTGEPLSVFMVDLDRFKQINDTFGHGAGDLALTSIAQQMTDLLRRSDRLGRYGGDEFLAVLPNTSAAQARDIARRLIEAIDDRAARRSGLPGLSIGVATAPEDGTELAALLAAADKALYANKRHRRARAGSLPGGRKG